MESNGYLGLDDDVGDIPLFLLEWHADLILGCGSLGLKLDFAGCVELISIPQQQAGVATVKYLLVSVHFGRIVRQHR